MKLHRLVPVVALSCLIGCVAETPAGKSGSHDPAPEEYLGDGDAGVAVASTAAALTIPSSEADTTLRAAVPFGNDGTGLRLGVTSVGPFDLERSLIKFRQTDIVNALGGQTFYAARLELTVDTISAGWLGGAVDIFRMTKTWPEGNGLLGNGPSWVCANDTNTTPVGNAFNDCTAANNWGMLPTDIYPQPYIKPATDRTRIFTGGTTVISFDVTADVQQFLDDPTSNKGWLLAGAASPVSGQWVNFVSREGAVASRPRLVIDSGADTCLGDSKKGRAGACGCGIPDRDLDFDDVPDCWEGVATATEDTTLRLAVPFGNDGTGTLLSATAASVVDLQRLLVRMNNAAIDAARSGRRVKKAYLELSVAGIAGGWGGGSLQVNKMTKTWQEGNGLLGHGASWFCADDTNTTPSGLAFNNCSAANNWGQQLFDPYARPYVATATATSPLSWPGPNTVRFDVTTDVNAFIASPSTNFGWIVQGAPNSPLSGAWVNFGSRESGAPPRLLMELYPGCPPGSTKTEPGVCGCFVADIDSDGDTVFDCQEECDGDVNKRTPGVCGCGVVDADSDGDCLPNCVDLCPSSTDTAAGGQCGCPGAFAPSGTPCGDGLGQPLQACDGAGHCGGVTSYAPEAGCACRLVRTQTRSYWFCPCTRTRTIADQRCRVTPGQQLADIGSREENDLVSRCLSATSWTGGNDITTEGQWRWASDANAPDTRFWNSTSTGSAERSRFTNWQAGQPATTTPDCAAMIGSGADKGKWQAQACANSLGFVCETDRANVRPGGPTTPPCDVLGTVCDTTPAQPCVSSTSQFGTQVGTEQQWSNAFEGQVNGCEACTEACWNQPLPRTGACTACNGCNVSLVPPPASPGACTTFEPPLVSTDADLCPLAVTHNQPLTMATCRDTGVNTGANDVGCPAGQECGYVSRCSACDPATEVCEACFGEKDCEGLDNRCVPYLACGTPACVYHCSVTPVAPAGVSPTECRRDSDCSGGQECGWASRCSTCDPATNPNCSTTCNENTNCNGGECIQYLACGTPIAGCFRNEPVHTNRCNEVNICGGVHDVAGTATLTNPPNSVPPINADSFDDEYIPTPAALPEIPPCGAPSPACPAPGGVLGGNHPYCNYGTVALNDQNTLASEAAQGQARAAIPPSGSRSVDPVSVTVDPDLSLDYQVASGPLGLIFPKVTAGASFMASVAINDVLMVSDTLDVITLKAAVSAGLDPAEELCGLSPGDSQALIFGMDLLPTGFKDDLTIPDETAQRDCADAVKTFTREVDKLKKAFFDAKELLDEYSDRITNGQTFPKPDGIVVSLCKQIGLDTLVVPPAPLAVTSAVCATELPEATINRFVRHFNEQLQHVRRDAVAAVIQELSGVFKSIPGGSADGLSFSAPIVNLHDLEEITILNQTFFVGPIPVLLQVLFTVEYGLNISATAELRIAKMLERALASPIVNDDQPVVWGGVEGTPYAQAGVGLFVGVGFDIGIAAASVGIEGTLTLARLDVPASAGAGINMEVQDDTRLTAFTPPTYVTEISPYLFDIATPAIPLRKFSFNLKFRYNAQLDLSNILGGKIDLRVRIKFLFFSKTWRKNLVNFTGIDPLPVVIFQGDQDVGSADWGTIELPMPFFSLAEIQGTVPLAVGQSAYNPGDHEYFTYELQCNRPPE